MEKSTIIAILLFLLVIIIGIFVVNNLDPSGPVGRAIAPPEPKPRLSVDIGSGETGWTLFEGCKSTIKGSVQNYGDASAQSVQVSCRLHGTKGQTTGSTNIGTIHAGGSTPFAMTIDNDCPKPNDVDCTASCYNC